MKSTQALIALGLILAIPTTPALAERLPAPARIGQWSALGNGLRIEPLAVIEDSRCPANARCIQAGRVVVKAVVQFHRHKQTVMLASGVPMAVAGGTLTLDSVMPPRLTTRKLTPANYRFTFTFAPPVQELTLRD